MPVRASLLSVSAVILAAIVRDVRRRLAKVDVLFSSAGLTFYAALGAVPLLLIGVKLAVALLGPHAVTDTADALARFLPGKLGVDRAIRALTSAGSTASWWAALAAVVPASLYSEGIVRSLERFSTVPERHSRTIRGRLFSGVLITVATMGIVVTVGALRPLLEHSFGSGTGPRLMGIVLAFVAGWVGATALLSLLYRLFATTSLTPAALIIGSAAAGSWILPCSVATRP